MGFNSVDNGAPTKETFFTDEQEDGAITLDYIMSDDYVEDTKDDYEFVISDYDGFTNDIDEKVRSNQGGSRKVNSINNVAEGSNKGRGKVEDSPFVNQQRRPSFSSPRPPLSPVTTTFWIVSSSPPTTTARATTTTARFSINQIDDITAPDQRGLAYDPCTELNACGPNAICTSRGTDPVCSCPFGFSGIPRNGLPDPSHGCVRTPQTVNIRILGIILIAEN